MNNQYGQIRHIIANLPETFSWKSALPFFSILINLFWFNNHTFFGLNFFIFSSLLSTKYECVLQLLQWFLLFLSSTLSCTRIYPLFGTYQKMFSQAFLDFFKRCKFCRTPNALHDFGPEKSLCLKKKTCHPFALTPKNVQKQELLKHRRCFPCY